MVSRINVLDLFSGIGGFSFALRDTCKTIAYCEKDSRCQAVLRHNMDRDLLDRGPVFDDVTLVGADDLAQLPEIHMITAGSPCQDISYANRYAMGIEGPRSRLIFDVFRIAGNLPRLQWILLENSPMIQSRGLDAVRARVAQMGWGAAWSTFDAREVGALHCRKRWFCLLTRKGAPALTVPRPLAMQAGCEPVRVARSHPSNTHRNRMLGNSVVPRVVQLALHILLQASSEDGNMTTSTSGKHVRCRLFTQTSEDRVVKDRWRRMSLVPHSPTVVNMAQGELAITRSCWATPTAKHWHRVHVLTHRQATTHLSIQIQYDTDTRRQALRVFETDDMFKFNVSPRFTEWLMGYPEDYTSLSPITEELP